MIPRDRLRRRQEQKVYDLIVEEFIPKVRFTASDVYFHASDPADLDMYAALDQLVFEKKLQKVLRLFDETDHTKMVYAEPGGDGYRSCSCFYCMELTIGPPGELCHECEEAGCDIEEHHDCQRHDAYEE